MASMFSVAAGLARVKRKLRAVVAQSKPAVIAELDKQGGILVTDIKARVPVDTGDLRDSVKKRRKGDAILVTEGDAKAIQARWVEFGTQQQDGQPHFFPIYRASRPRIKSAVRKAVRKAVRNAVGKP